MTAPKRIQRKRVKGYRMPAGTIYVGRPTKWGNPFGVVREGGFMWVEPGGTRIVCSTDRATNMRERHQEAVDLYRAWMADSQCRPMVANGRFSGTLYYNQGVLGGDLETLRGHDLACWCPLDLPCHADVLLELANGGAQ
ncbi:DUF4326 domain-containing protein [Gordonia sihwensis]|uniref:DUF4326 domain-containing protein n=1 Tax=Gordonia sihwensis TaxID=173559 RepID=UPI0009E54D68|nr:DUF4326 domain-containing protein [Gordonia sihwensis]